MSITVKLLGTPSVIKDGQQIVFPYRKAEGLFYYLCVKQTISRDEAVGVFWADCAENTARKNLRDATYHLKKLLGDDVICNEGNSRISLNKDANLSVDYNELAAETLTDIHTGEFLEFFYVKNCLEFEDWTTEIREGLLRRYQTTMEKRIVLLSTGHDGKALMECGNSLLHKRVYDESIYMDIIRGLIRMGAYSEVESLYQKLEAALQEELGVSPDKKLTELMDEVEILRSVHDMQTDAENEDTFFYGREAEILELREFVAKRSAPAVLLTGEAGIGKTAILRRFQSSLCDERSFLVFYQCVQPESALYLKPWDDIFAQIKEYCSAIDIDSPPMMPMEVDQSDTLIHATQYERFAKAMLQAFLQNPKGQELIILIDDIQWMDKESLRLLNSLIFWSNRYAISIVMASRDVAGDNLRNMTSLLEAKGLLREIPVQRFTKAETSELIGKQNQSLLTLPEVIDTIYQKSGGNALFLTEILREIEHSGNTKQISAKATGMIESRLLELKPYEREVLNAISLFPRFATAEELSAILGQPKITLLKTVEHLIMHHLIRLGRTYNKMGYGFSHQIIRDYIYYGMIEEKRYILHEIIASYYEAKYLENEDIGLCPMLIYHFDCCKNTIKSYTYQLEYLKRFYAAQHEIYPTIMVEPNVIEQVLPRLSGEDALVELAERVRMLRQPSAEVDALRMKVEFLLGRYDLFSGAFEKGLKNIAASIAMAKRLNDSHYLMDNYLQMVFHAIQIHDLEMFDRYITECEKLLEQYSYSSTDMITVTRLRGVYYMKKQQFPRAEEIFREIIEQLEPICRTNSSYRIGLAACYNYLGEIRQTEGDLDAALGYYLRAIDCCSDEHIVGGMGVMHSHAGYVLYTQKRFDLAQEHIEKANECFAACGALWGRAEAMSCAALLAMERGDWASAEKMIHSAQSFALRSGNSVALFLVEEVSARFAKRGVV